MQGWRDLRAARPNLFRFVEVMQQPAAVTDSLIHKWRVKSLMKQYGDAMLWVRDTCGGGGYAAVCRSVNYAGSQLTSWIAAKMTAALQPTDTDFAG